MKIDLQQNYSSTQNTPFLRAKPSKRRLHSQHFQQQESIIDFEEQDFEQNYNFETTMRKNDIQIQPRQIKKSILNRSCINTMNFNCKNLQIIPKQITNATSQKLNTIQKIDLSFNSIQSIQQIRFQDLIFIKQLYLNSNQLLKIPFKRINLCKNLKIINLNNNHIDALYPLDKVSQIYIQKNPLRLITSKLIQLDQIQIFCCDWINYLTFNNKNKSLQELYYQLKTQLLPYINYNKIENQIFCDFNTYFTTFIQKQKNKYLYQEQMGQLIAQCFLQRDFFFIEYLKGYQNDVNYQNLKYNDKLLLQIALQNPSRPQLIQLFKLRKKNYINSKDQIFFKSILLTCKYHEYDMFRYLFYIKQKNHLIKKRQYLSKLIKQTIQYYNKDKDGDKILYDLTKLYKDHFNEKITIKIPYEYNNKQFKHLSLAHQDIMQDKLLNQIIQFVGQKYTTSSLHFAMRSRNQQLVKSLIYRGDHIFQVNHAGITPKYMQGSTQTSKKILWKKQKAKIKDYFSQPYRRIDFNFKTSQKQIKHTKQITELPSVIKNDYPFLINNFLFLSQDQKYKQNNYKQKNNLKSIKNMKLLTNQIKNIKFKKQYILNMISYDLFQEQIKKIKINGQDNIYKKQDQKYLVQESLNKIYKNLDNNQLLQYQIAQTNIYVFQNKQYTKNIQKNSYKKIQGPGLWCCQNSMYS